MRNDDAPRQYHREPRPGKIEVVPTKPCLTQTDLSLAYTPGVAVPCLDIEKNPECAFDYTTRGNLIAVITNGTAVLGLGDIGPLAAKPVMEGKAVLFKRFANIDVFDIEINTTDTDEFIHTVKLLEPTFGGINLEDIRAPDCFYIEEQLQRQMDIPVFHDDQHGTAIISGAALLNAVALTDRRIEDLRVVINGAGAAGIACARLYVQLGVRKKNLIMVDSRGVIYRGRQEGMNRYKSEFALETSKRHLEKAVVDADMLVGLSVKDAFTEAMIASMNARPIIFALANPDPEIDYDHAKKIRPDAIVATGRSDYPNQVNNVLGFPYIFRGALDVHATTINEEMKVAAVRALAELAREDVPDAVIRSYGGSPIQFGTDYIIPKPLDTRVLLKVVPAVAAAAVESGVAGSIALDTVEYTHRLEATLGPERETMRSIITTAQQNSKRIVLPEGEHPVILRAAYQAFREGIAHPLLLGNNRRINGLTAELQIPVDGFEIIDPADNGYFDAFSEKLFHMRSRKGWTMTETRRQLRNPYVFGAMMVHEGMVDGQVHGIDQSYPNAIRPVLQVIPRRPGVSKVSGLYLMIIKNRSYLLADTTVNICPDAETVAEIAILAAEMAEFFNMEPRVAMLSYSNFGSVRDANARRVAHAVGIVRRCRPGLLVDGEMQADTAVVTETLSEQFPFNRLGKAANVLIFPDLSSGNMAYKLLERLGGAKAVGPLLMGISKPFNVLQRNTEMENVVNVIAITVAQMQRLEQAKAPYCEIDLNGSEGF
ncbi:NADP-dependent malic enzyme (EC [Olavius algarvensis associated proteobacterium Delta 3]|nr:NADP-dependent malic enzyme (EC [Olavius algarvensis associated proteobacterium Delta 3]CAB5151166.1 NADP-dependent malic enzyme (EC [Olavius algarvensis associated proteobacterium Delta 3]